MTNDDSEQPLLKKLQTKAKDMLARGRGNFELQKIGCGDSVFQNINGKWALHQRAEGEEHMLH